MSVRGVEISRCKGVTFERPRVVDTAIATIRESETTPRQAHANFVPRGTRKGGSVITDSPTTLPRLGFTVTETPRPPAPVEPDPFIARPAPAGGAAG